MQSINPLTIFYASLGLIALSGFGILFLNEETILAICFFIFLYLLIQNSDAASEAIESQKEVIRLELLTSLVKGQRDAVNAKVLLNHRKYELTSGLEALFQSSDNLIQRTQSTLNDV